MSDKTGIEWTEATWNPVTGCSKVSQGCKNCYAEREWPRLAANLKTVYFGREFTDVRYHPERLDQPLRWKRPRRIFVNSMSDLFHEAVPDEFIAQVFAVMELATVHTFQVLTKRPKRMMDWVTKQDVMYRSTGYPGGFGGRFKNVWLGVSVEDQDTADQRVPILLETPAAVRWVSVEPLLGEVNFVGMFANPGDCRDGTNTLEALDWVVVGGESGPKARPMHPDWVRSLRDQCQAAGRTLDGRTWDDYPDRPPL